MKIQSVKIVNILSIEEAFVEFDDSGLILVQGWNYDVGRANGAGKTAIFNAITFALYNKLPRKITATEILRRGSKAGYVELCVQVGTDQFVVKRSRPTGVLFSKGAETLTISQEGWERILGLNYDQFVISMYASQGASTRFLSINDSDKKQFLLQLLNLEEFADCKTLADKKVNLFQADLASNESKIDALNSKISAYSESLVDEESISNMIRLGNESLSTWASAMAPFIAVPKPDLSKYQKLEEDLSVKKDEFIRTRARREMLHEQYRKIQSKSKPIHIETECSQCGHELDTTAKKAQHDKLLDRCKVELLEVKSQIDACDSVLFKENIIADLQIKLLNKKKEESKEYEKAKDALKDFQSKVDLKQQELKQLNLKLQNNSVLQSKIKDLSSSCEEFANNRAIILRNIELYKTVSAMYSPTGAQAYILDSVIESFNERIVEYVNLLWSNLTYELRSYKENVKGDVTAKFSELLVMDGKPISIGSLSGGEFRALSLCVDFALVDVMERQFGISMSPVILDEPFDGLDGSGRELIVELLETLAERRQVVIVDHSSEIKSMFSKVITVEKRGGISKISLES
jgi:exonuclease SbcC